MIGLRGMLERTVGWGRPESGWVRVATMRLLVAARVSNQVPPYLRIETAKSLCFEMAQASMGVFRQI